MSTARRSMPVLRLKDRGSLRWLERALSLELVAVHPEDEATTFQHAELRFGDDWIMASGGGGRLDDRPLGAVSMYLVVATDEEVDTAYERALAAGATNALEPVDQDYGGRGASVRDLEGNVWSFGSYRPEGA